MAKNGNGEQSLGALIEIGSDSVRMRIAQLAPAGWREIENLQRAVQLGREVFSSRRISFSSLELLSEILSGYSQVLAEYGVTRVRTIATTAVREASNRDYILDLLRIRNGHSVNILDENAESALAFTRMLEQYAEQIHAEGTLLAYLGTGNLGLAYVQGGQVLYSGILPTGVRRINELLDSVQDRTSHFGEVLEEYVRTLINHVRIHLEGMPVHALLLCSRLLRSRLPAQAGLSPEHGVYRMPGEHLDALYARLRTQYRPAVAPSAEDEIYIPLLAVVKELQTLAAADEILIPDFDISDVLIDNMNSNDRRSRHRETIRQNVLSSARHMAAAFRCDLKHADMVRRFALPIYDCLRKPHGLGRRSRMLLEAATWLHDVGYYINTRNHRSTAFELLRNTTLFGLGERDMYLIACVAGFDEYESGMERFASLPFADEKDRILAVKLATILQVANTLDQSHTQRLSEPRVEIEESRLVIHCRSISDAVLERWALRRWTPAFEEVFGLQPELVVESDLIDA